MDEKIWQELNNTTWTIYENGNEHSYIFFENKENKKICILQSYAKGLDGYEAELFYISYIEENKNTIHLHVHKTIVLNPNAGLFSLNKDDFSHNKFYTKTNKLILFNKYGQIDPKIIKSKDFDIKNLDNYPAKKFDTPNINSDTTDNINNSQKINIHIQNTISKTQFTNIDGTIEKEESIQITTNDKLVYKYCTIEDSGIEIDRVINNTIVWRIFAKPLNVSHSKYKHQAKIKIRDKSIFISSIGSYGKFYEERDLQTGKLIYRKEEK
jgi:hypothetical protein